MCLLRTDVRSIYSQFSEFKKWTTEYIFKTIKTHTNLIYEYNLIIFRMKIQN